VFEKSPFSNLFLFLSTAGSFAIHVAALYLGPTQYVLRVEPILAWRVWAEMIAVASSILVAMELHKIVRGRRAQPGHDATADDRSRYVRTTSHHARRSS
jgi:Ca2+-transporting ATPase